MHTTTHQRAHTIQAPPLDNEPQLLRTLERVCHQHGATDTTTHRLLGERVGNVRHATYLEHVTAALKNYESSEDPDVDTLDILITFARHAITAAQRDITTTATAADLAPEIREAITVLIDMVFEREADDYQQQDHDDRADHSYLHLTALNTWLGPYSPVR